jgi:aldose 1-epimerase
MGSTLTPAGIPEGLTLAPTTSQEDLMHLAAGDVSVVVDPGDGGRLVSLRVGALELIGGSDLPQIPAAMNHGSFPMAPWAGRIRNGEFSFRGRDYRLPATLGDHATHGVTFNSEWTRSGPQTLGVQFGAPWPFGGSAAQEFDLTPEGLRITLTATAMAAAMPVVLGLHPWFARRLAVGKSAELIFTATNEYQRAPDGLPTGDLVPASPGPWDDCFILPDRRVTIRWPQALDLVISSNHEHFVIFDELDEALCVEPQTGPPDAFNIGGSVTLEPGATYRLAVELRLIRQDQ